MYFTTQTIGRPVFVYDPNAPSRHLKDMPAYISKDLKCAETLLPRGSVLPQKDPNAPEQSLLPTGHSTLPASVLPSKLKTCKAPQADSTSLEAAIDAALNDPDLPTVQKSPLKVPMTAPCVDCTFHVRAKDKSMLDAFAEELAYAAALANMQIHDTKNPDGKRYGIPGGMNANGPDSVVTQMAAAAVGVTAAILAGAGVFEKALRRAIKNGVPLMIKVGEKAGVELTADVAKYLSAKWRYKIADALRANGAIGPYSVMKRFTDGMGGQLQAHHLFEVAQMRAFKFPNPDAAPSILLTAPQHAEITAQLMARTKRITTMDGLWRVYTEVYGEFPHWLKAIEPYFRR